MIEEKEFRNAVKHSEDIAAIITRAGSYKSDYSWGRYEIKLNNNYHCSYAIALLYQSNNTVSISYQIDRIEYQGEIERNSEALYLKRLVEKLFNVVKLTEFTEKEYWIESLTEYGKEIFEKVEQEREIEHKRWEEERAKRSKESKKEE